MFDRVLGLPAHPLLVHAAVVLVPLLALTAIVYAVAPFTRRHIRWPVIVLALAAPGAAFAAKLSGDAFSKNDNFVADEMQTRIGEHKEWGDVLVWLVLGLAVVALVLALVVRGAVVAARRSPDDTLTNPPRGTLPLPLQLVLIVATVALAAASLYYVFRSGDTGAKLVWTGF